MKEKWVKDRKIQTGENELDNMWPETVVPAVIIVDSSPIKIRLKTVCAYITYSSLIYLNPGGLNALRKYVYRAANINRNDMIEFIDESESVKKTSQRTGLNKLFLATFLWPIIEKLYVVDTAGLGWPEGFKEHFIQLGIDVIEMTYESNPNA